MDGLSVRDLRLLRDAFDPDLNPADDDLIPHYVLDEIDRLIPADNIVLQVMNYAERTMSCQSTRYIAGDHDPQLRSLFWSGFWDSTCSHPQRTGDTSIVWSGFRPLPASGGSAQMRQFIDTLGWRDELLVPLGPEGIDDHRLLLFRSSGPQFSERDVLLLTLLRAAVAERHARHVRRRSGAATLTARQTEILRLVAAGATNRQIARALTISEGTARTHLANIYTKLGVTNRTQALVVSGIPT